MDVPASLTDARSRVTAALRQRFTVDTRSLAAFRIALGLLLLADLALRSRSLTAFYTDAGVLPRAIQLSTTSPWKLSVHVVSGDLWFQALLFLVAGLVALALTVGYRTSTAAVVSWVLLLSLQNRNTLVLNGGDVLLRMLLFWALFVPLAERWSVYSQRWSDHRTAVVSVATVALLLQVVIVYVKNAAYKLSGDTWVRGEAFEYVLSLEQFTVFLGDVIPTYAPLMQAIDYLWLGMVTASVFLVLLTGRRRVAVVGLFVGAHLGMLLTMQLGLFPLISITGLLPFLPGSVWDAIDARLRRHDVAARLCRLPADLAAVLPVVTISQVPPSVQWLKAGLQTAVPLCFLVLIVLWNLQAGAQLYGYDTTPEQTEPVYDLTRTDQYWNMFAPEPLYSDTWFVVPALLDNGTRVDAFHGGSVQWEKPADVSETFPSARWRKYLTNLHQWGTRYQPAFGEYLCDRWKRNHETGIRNVSVYAMEQPTRIHDETEPVNRVHVESHTC